MNTPTIIPVKLSTKLEALAAAIITLFFAFIGSTAKADWTVDFSRRSQNIRTQDLRGPASVGSESAAGGAEFPQDPSNAAQAYPAPQAQSQPVPQAQAAQPSFFESLFQSGDIAQEIVVLNTEKGFVPSTIRVKKGLNYQIHIVNVNEKEKNVSFVLDSFSEHHATYYGKIKSFLIRPAKEGVYKFVSPETSAQGKLVVFPAGPTPAVNAENRLPASE